MRSLGVAAISVALILALSGCTAPEPEPEPEPSPTPTGFASEEEASAAAQETIERFLQELDTVDHTNHDSIEEVYTWLVGDALAFYREDLTAGAAEGYATRGSSIVTLFEATEVDTLGRTVSAAICVDVSDVDVVNSAGESVVSPDRPDVQSLSIELVSSGTPTGLAIEHVGGREGEPRCDGE